MYPELVPGKVNCDCDYKGAPTTAACEKTPGLIQDVASPRNTCCTCRPPREDLEEAAGEKDVWAAMIVSATTNKVQMCSLKNNEEGFDL